MHLKMGASGAISPSLVQEVTGTHSRTMFLIFVFNLLCNLTEAFKLPGLNLSLALCSLFQLGTTELCRAEVQHTVNMWWSWVSQLTQSWAGGLAGGSCATPPQCLLEQLGDAEWHKQPQAPWVRETQGRSSTLLLLWGDCKWGMSLAAVLWFK